MRQTRLLRSFSFLLFLTLTTCMSGAPKRPDAYLYQINVTETEGSEAYGYNTRHDFDDDANLKPGAQPKINPLSSLWDLRGWYCTDQTGYERSLAYRKAVDKWVKEHCK